MKAKLVYKGGSGSGNFGHAGIPGQVGGSASGGGSPKSFDTLKAGKVSVGDTVFYRTQLQRNRGLDGKNGVIMNAPDSGGYVKVTIGLPIGGDADTVDTVEIHTDDIIKNEGTGIKTLNLNSVRTAINVDRYINKFSDSQAMLFMNKLFGIKRDPVRTVTDTDIMQALADIGKNGKFIDEFIKYLNR